MSFLFTILSLFSTESFACAPPRFPFDGQLPNLRAVVESPVVRDQVIACGGHYVTKIEQLDTGGFVITLNNDSSFLAKTVWSKPRGPGMCPSITGVEIVSASCR